MEPSEPTCQIFSGCYSDDRDVSWLESVVGLAAAQERMQTLEKPGPYFVFGLESHTVLAITDTRPTRRANEGAA
jgi:hypothetical protein